MRTTDRLALTMPTRRAIAKYGERTCLEAFHLSAVIGEGANTISWFGLPNIKQGCTQSADAAIDAGRELLTGRRH